jgi:hypothetical protein
MKFSKTGQELAKWPVIQHFLFGSLLPYSPAGE